MGSLHVDVFELKRYKLLQHFCGFVALVVLCDVLFRVEVRKLSMLLIPQEHWADNHFFPAGGGKLPTHCPPDSVPTPHHSRPYGSIPVLTAKGSLNKALIVKDAFSDKLFVVGCYHSGSPWYPQGAPLHF